MTTAQTTRSHSRFTKRRTIAAALAVVVAAGAAFVIRSRSKNTNVEDAVAVPPQPTASAGPHPAINASNAKKLQFSSMRARVGVAEANTPYDALLADEWEVAGLSPDGTLAAIVIGRRWLHVVELATAKTRASYLGSSWRDLEGANVAVWNDGRAAWPMWNHIAMLTPASATQGRIDFKRCEGMTPSSPGFISEQNIAYVSYSPAGSVTCVGDLDRRAVVERSIANMAITEAKFPTVALKTFREKVQPAFFDRQPIKRDIWWEPASWTDRFGDASDDFTPTPDGYVDPSGKPALQIEGSFQSAGRFAVVSRQSQLAILDVASGKESGTVVGTEQPLPRPKAFSYSAGPNLKRTASIALANGGTRVVPAGFETVAETADGSFVAWLGYPGDRRTLSIVETKSGRLKQFEVQGGGASVAPYGQSSFVFILQGDVFVLDASSFTRAEIYENPEIALKDLEGVDTNINSSTPNLAVSPDQNLLAIDDRNDSAQNPTGAIRLFSLNDGRQIGAVAELPFQVQTGLQFSADGTQLLVGDDRLVAVLTVKP
jgi:hypothetical protein